MPSRKKRKRYRQRAEATAKGPGSQGGWGKGLPLTPRDLLLVRQAIRENWPVPDDVGVAVIENIFDGALAPECKPRLQIAAVRCLIDMVKANQRADELDELWGRPGAPVIAHTASGCDVAAEDEP